MIPPAAELGAHASAGSAAEDGVIVVDKPADWTSHDVVARIRRLAGTRRVGHAGTLDPMATGVLVIGIGRATRLLGHLSGRSKEYAATIRLGWATHTDDSQGERLAGNDASGLSMMAIEAAISGLCGHIRQRPSAVSAIKVNGRRAHELVRSGQSVRLPERPVRVDAFKMNGHRRDELLGVIDLSVHVSCSSGTYVRALARDLGEVLAVGGHLTSLRRERVGPFVIEEARTMGQLEAEVASVGHLEIQSLGGAACAAFPVIGVAQDQVGPVLHGRAIDLNSSWEIFRDLAKENLRDEQADWTQLVEPHALLDPQGCLLALVSPRIDGSTRYLAVFPRSAQADPA